MTNQTDGLDAAGVAVKPCPFCGGAGKPSHDDVGYGLKRWRVWCESCVIATPGFHDETQAIAAWNRRSALVDAPAGETGVREPKYVAIHSSEDPVERLAYELAVELEQADLDRNDFVTVNRAKLLAIASRAVASITAKPSPGLKHRLWEALRFSASRSVINAAEEMAILEAFTSDPLASPTPSVAALQAEIEREVAWLIERKFPAETLWYAENASGWHSWTSAAVLAKRFASKAEAEAFPAYQMIASDPAIYLTEHVFMG